MNFKIKNFGKIVEADIKFDGITVICGNNDTGKSTVGKALFAFFNSLYDYKKKIAEQKNDKLRDFIINHVTDPVKAVLKISNGNRSFDHILNHTPPFTIDEIQKYLESEYDLNVSKDKLSSVVDYLNMPETDILNEYVFRYVNRVMNGQAINVYTPGNSGCSIIGEFNDHNIEITLDKQTSSCKLGEPIEHCAYYINDPFSLDHLNEHIISIPVGNPMSNSVIKAIQEAQAAINEDSMTNILDSVKNKKELEKVREIIKKAYSGDTVIDHGKYFYSENGISYDFRNISAGLKSFALIERLLETGVLKKKDVLILDEPEIHLHSEWQIIYAELIVILQKMFDLTILLVTHSYQFLESLNYYMERYEIAEKGNQYIPIEVKNGVKIEDSPDNLERMKKCLKSGMFTLANKKLEEITSGDSDEEDN